jgi:integrase
MSQSVTQGTGLLYDIALSFASEQRALAEQLAARLRAAGVRVFYDKDSKAELWGKNLVDHLHDIYCDRARFCVVFVSKEYVRKGWTNHERKAAQERVFREVSGEYLLPIRVDDAILPGLPETVGYVSITDGIHEIARTLLEKLDGRGVYARGIWPTKLKLKPSTKQRYHAEFARFRTWAEGRRLPAFPTTVEVAALYLEALADAPVEIRWKDGRGQQRARRKRYNYSSLRSAYMAIIHAHRSSGHEWPQAHPRIAEVMAAAASRRDLEPNRKAPLAIAGLKKILVATRERRYEDLTAVRDRAMLSVGFFGAFRRQELVSLDMSDLRFVDRGLIVTIRKAMGSVVGRRRDIGIPPHSDPRICPIRLLKRYLELSEISSGPVFRRIDRNGCLGNRPLTAAAFDYIVKGAAERAGLDPAQFGTHSLRAGFVTTAAASGKSLHDIMRQTGHRHPRTALSNIRLTVAERSEEDDLFDDNAADGID